MTIKDKTILITGGAGFIGSNLADKLIPHNKIIVIDNFDNFYDPKIKEKNISANLRNKNYIFYKSDITDITSLEKIFSENNIDIIIHLAAKAGVRASIKNPKDYIHTNILGTVNILETAKKYKIKKMLFASSSSVYGNCKEDIFSEDLKLSEPISPYAATKLAAEQFCYTYHKLYGIKILCLRLFTVYGPRQRPDLAIHKFLNLINENKPVPVYGDGSTKRNYTYIDDIVSGFISAINYEKTGYETINLGGKESIRLDNMIKTLEKALKKPVLIEYLPLQKGDVDKTAADITKAKKILDYSPKTSFNEGIKKFIEWSNSK